LVAVVRVKYTPTKAEISSGRSLNPNVQMETKLWYGVRLQRLKKTSENAVGGKGLRTAAIVE